MRYFLHGGEGVVYSAPDDGTVEEFEASDAYREVLVVPLDELPATRLVRKGESIRAGDPNAREDTVALVSRPRPPLFDPWIEIRTGKPEELRSDARTLWAIANRLEEVQADPERDERVEKLRKDVTSALVRSGTYEDVPGLAGVELDEVAAFLDELGYRRKEK